ncbi:MAG: VWA domain-containing protein [Chloroflexi bacterium]|nr:VWA domain-containing protein [Chloroflexota bacterium]
MRNKTFSGMLLAVFFLMTYIVPVQADGIIIPEPPICNPITCPRPPISQTPLTVKEHIVTVKIKDQLAVTHVDQTFINTGNSTVEGTYIFPLPSDAVVQNFTLWVAGKPVNGKVLSAEEARQTYEDIVRSMRDPALLEYMDRGAVQASIFPIGPGESRRVELEYTQALTAEGGLVKYSYPLNTEKFSAEPLEKVSVTVEIETGQPIRAVYSPSHEVDILRKDENNAVASYEASNIKPDTDFDLFYSYGNEEALHLFTYLDGRDPSDPDGFFLLLAAPRPEANIEHTVKDILLVIDRSGSMEGEKIRQAKSAAKYVLSHLGEADRFHFTTFSSGIEQFAPGLSPASDASKAIDWVDSISAGGSTDINRALLSAAKAAESDRPAYLLFLTDGLPTVGIRDSRRILANFADAAGENIRIFPFGVGYDVDTLLLDSLSQNHHGASTYVKPEEDLDAVLSGFYEKISTPVLTDLELEFSGIRTYDVYPQPLPDLFQGSQLVVTGRYHEGGKADIRLKGKVNGESQTFRYDNMTFTEESPSIRGPESSLPRLWAARKIGSLLNSIRLEGVEKETVDQIVKLSIRYGIVTPYTSYLVTEPPALGAVEQERLSTQTFGEMKGAAAAPSFGADAVQKAEGQNRLAQSESAPAITSDASQIIKNVGARTFVLKDGVWTDTAYDPDTMTARKIKFLSDEYFNLSRSNPTIAACLALGTQVLVVDGHSVIQIIE